MKKVFILDLFLAAVAFAALYFGIWGLTHGMLWLVHHWRHPGL